MKEDYPLKGDTVKIEYTLERDVTEIIKKMAEYTKLSEAELVNTAVKRFISTHSDFLPRKK